LRRRATLEQINAEPRHTRRSRSKRLTSRYKSGSCKSWLKVKNRGYERTVSAQRPIPVCALGS
jgi:hypothetical protein